MISVDCNAGSLRTRVIGLAAAFAGASAASANNLTVSDPFIVVNASSALGNGSVVIPLNSPDVTVYSDPSVDYAIWGTTQPVPIYNNSNQIVAVLISMNVTAARNTIGGVERWGVDVDFNVQAGAADTSIQLISPVVGFSPLTGASASTSATLGGTDQDGNGLTITPSLTGGVGYQALINGASVFQSYFSSILTAGAGLSTGVAGNMTPSGAFVPIGGSVSSAQSIFGFTVSANDAAAGTSTFAVIPEPGVVTTLALGGMLAARRRR